MAFINFDQLQRRAVEDFIRNGGLNNQLTGQPLSIPGLGQLSPTGFAPQGGLGGMPQVTPPPPDTPASPAAPIARSYLPQPVSPNQRMPSGLGSDVFRSTLAPLQQENFGLGQVDPRFLTGPMRVAGGNNASIPFAMPPPLPQRPPVRRPIAETVDVTVE